MSTATTAAEPPAPVRGRKKLILIAAAALLTLAVAGGAAALVLKQRAAAQAELDADDGGTPAETAGTRRAAPVFVPLEPFTVNLADRNADRYAQVGITLEIDGSDTGERIKTYMPAIRNNILMAIADRTAAELLDREGKAQLAERVRRETARALGLAVDGPVADAAGGEPRKRRAVAVELPVKAVHFSNFIIQ